MTRINREDIQIIARNSNWSEENVERALKKNVYNDKSSWQKFLKLLFISLGVGFTVSGIIFFFAYNWADLDKFIKIGLIEGLLIVSALVILFSKLNLDIKNILLTGTSILVGVLFAVFGQIYQTGANAYDFFLGWTLFITIWVLVSNYAPLWLIYIILINTTALLYADQVAHDWSEVFIFNLLFIINTLFLSAFLIIKKFNNKIHSPIWFTNLIALGCVSFSTLGIVVGMFEINETAFFVLIALTSICYGLGIKFGLQVKSGFYLSIIPFSLIIIISALLIKITSEAGMFFIVSLFVIGSVTFVIKNLIDLQKKWKS